MLLEPVRDYFSLLNEGYLFVIVAVPIAWVSVTTYLDREAKVSKIVLFLVGSITFTSVWISLTFFVFLAYQYVFAQKYEYLQLSVSIFLIYLTLMTGLSVNRAILERQPFDFILYTLGVIMLLLVGTIFPMVFVLPRIVWTAIS